MSVPPSYPPSDESLSSKDGRLERFLELAAPVLLEEPDLECESNWRQLERMAERAGLNGEELKGVVESLRQEGVIAGGDTSRGSSDPTASPISDEEIDSYLAPLPPPRRPVPPTTPIAERWRAAAAAARSDPTRFLTGDPRAGKSPAQLKAQVRLFLRNAEGVIAEQRGLTPRACLLLTDLAHSMGLAEHDYDAAMAVLRTRTKPAAGGEPDRPDMARQQTDGGKPIARQVSSSSVSRPAGAGVSESDRTNAPARLSKKSQSPKKQQPAKQPPGKQQPGKPEPSQSELDELKGGKSQQGMPQPVKVELGKAELGKAEPGKAEPGKAELRKSQPETSQPETSQPETSQSADVPQGAVAVEGEGERPPAPPADRFRKYLSVAIGEKQRTRGYISESAERKLIEEGVSKLGLSTVYARHLVLEMAERSRTPVLSLQTGERGEPVDERLEQFMARAAPILAKERGATQRAYVLLSTIAQELKLGDQSFRQGMNLLQSAWGESGKEGDFQQERRGAWRGHLQHAFQGLSGQVLTPAESERLVRMGVERFGLEESVTTSVLSQVATEARVHLIWRDQALAHMRAVVGQALGDRVRLDRETQARLASEGEQWGIFGEQVRRLIDDQAGENLRRRRRERRMATMVVLAGFLATVAAMVSFYVFVFLPRVESRRTLNEKEREATHSPNLELRDDPVSLGMGAAGEGGPRRDSIELETDPSTLTGEPPPSASSSAAPAAAPRPSARNAWWDDGMRIAWINLRRELNEGQLVRIQGIEGESAEARAASYESLIQMLLDDELNPPLARNAHDFVARAVAAEPDSVAVDRWLDAALALVPDMDQAIPDNSAEFARAVRAVRLIAVAAIQSRSSRESSGKSSGKSSGGNESRILGRVHRKLPAVVTEATPAADLEREYVGELLRRWCRNVTRAARSLETARVAEHWTAIRPTMTRNLTRDEVLSLTVNLLKVALPQADHDWRLLQLAIQDAILSPDSNHVLRMVDVFERVRRDEPRRYMAALLLSRAEVSFQDLIDLDDVPDLVRKALGAPAGPHLDEQELSETWMDRVDQLLAELPAAPPSDQQVIMQTMQLARLASWGMAMARRQPDAALAIARRKDMEPVGSDDDIPSDDPTRFVESTMLRARMTGNDDYMNRAADLLKRSGANAWQQRLRGLEILARTIPGQPELLTADLASDVAGYLLSNRSSLEHRERLAAVPHLKDSVTLQIALAHEIRQLSARDAAARETIAAFLGEESTWDSSKSGWQREAQRRLLQQALSQLPGGSASLSSDIVEQLQEVLWQEYREQAQLLGIPSSEWSDLETASELRRVMLKRHAETLLARWKERSQKEKSSDRERRVRGARLLPERMAGEIMAAEYVAANDVALTILLDRLWIRLLAWEMDFEGQVDEALDEVLEDLTRADQRAVSLMEQLRATQKATVKLWRLRLRGGDS